MYTKIDRSAKTYIERIPKKSIINDALAVGKANFADYKVMPQLGMIDEPMEINGWDFRPFEMDDCEIPREAWRQVELLREQDIPILQVIVGHNLKEEEDKRKRIEAYRNNLEKIGKAMAVTAGVALTLVTWLAGAVTALVLGFITLVLAVDPILIVVLEDGTWLCVAEWDS
ncbi:MAG: hypothetical protein CL608_30465 [Anaerolineaceae bacterium]|nr:hypothetical protein [Anaerolineaceae bacterium]